MVRPGFRSRLRILAGGAVLLLACGLLWWIHVFLIPRLLEAERRDLARTARMVAVSLEGGFSDREADRLAGLAGVRITFVTRDGEVAGDSEVPASRLPDVENHADRPEVAAALRGREGFADRVSETTGLHLLYAAVPHPEGAVRVSTRMPAGASAGVLVERAVLVAAASIFLLLLVAGRPLERWVAAPFRALARRAGEFAAGGGGEGRTPAPGEGPVAELAGTLERIGARLERAEEVRAELLELEKLLDRMEDGLAVTGPDGTVERANRPFRRWAGGGEVEGRRLDILFRDPSVAGALRRALEGEVTRLELRFRDRTASLLLRPDGDGVTVTVRDLTRVRQLEGVRRDFVANASHELKTPLTSVMGFAEALTESDLPPEQAARFGRRILANGLRMRRLIDDLLDLSRIESGAWQAEPRPVELALAGRAAWQELEEGDPERELSLGLEGMEEAPLVQVDPEALRQILRNLLDNARRYAPPGSTVRLSARRRDGRVRVAVSDDGPGIPNEHRERVFERFYRVDAARSREEGGTGLGLAIVKHLVAAHGGEVGLESEVGRGTKVWFDLPSGDRESSAGP